LTRCVSATRGAVRGGGDGADAPRRGRDRPARSARSQGCTARRGDHRLPDGGRARWTPSSIPSRRTHGLERERRMAASW
jgi:hypothetical protein